MEYDTFRDIKNIQVSPSVKKQIKEYSNMGLRHQAIRMIRILYEFTIAEAKYLVYCNRWGK